MNLFGSLRNLVGFIPVRLIGGRILTWVSEQAPVGGSVREPIARNP